MFITSLLLILIVYLVYHCYVQYGRYGQLINSISGPSGYPIIGNLLQIQGSSEYLWKLLMTLSDQYYSIWKMWVFVFCMVSIRHPDDLEIMLSSTTNITKSRIYWLLHPWLGKGLLTSEGSKWHLRRKILTPTFHFNILQQFVEILIEESRNMTKSLKENIIEIEGTVVKDLVPFISEHTLNAISETAMGISLKGMGSTFQQQYRDAVHQMGQIVVNRLVRPWKNNDWIFSLMSEGREQRRVLKILHGFTEKIIAERKIYHKRTNGQYLKDLKSAMADNVEIIGSRKKRLAMLDLLILASEECFLTDLDIREEVDTFMFEGHDTTAMGICFALVLLAEHKDIQDRVREEINTVMQENEEKLTMKSLQDLQYLERCIKEALRLYPSVFFISRITSEDTQLKSYLIPANTIMHLNIYGVHRDPNFWPNPEVFDPDRFLPEKIRNRHPYSYIPFSAGPRNCIGQRFAMLEMKAMISHLIYNFYLEPVDYLKDITILGDLILRPAHPLRVRFIPITKCT